MAKTPAEEALEALANAQDEFMAAQYELEVAVTNARLARVTWAEIGRVFGVSRQSAQSSWGKIVEEEIAMQVDDVVAMSQP